MSKNAPSLIGTQEQKPAAPPEATAAAPAKRPSAKAAATVLRWFVVESPDKVIRERGKNEYVIRQGKELNSAEYDIDLLLARGVKLSPIPTPNWYKEAQERGEELHAELARKGVKLPAPPPYVDPDQPATG